MTVLLQIKNACKSYGDQVLLDHADAMLADDVKVGFVGRNGSGKSTLLRILLGEEELDSGEIFRHSSLRLGYLRQHDPFLPGETTLEFLIRDSGQPEWKCGEVAGEFEIKGDYLNGPIARLSGGWQTRVKLAALLLHEPNLLLLDEPTNFLDLRTQILLEHFLRHFPEAALVVSHDRAFLAATCSQTLGIDRGQLTMFPGRIDAFLEHQREKREHHERVNAATLAKRRQLEEFIARNKARASTASRARSKSKQLERLELIEVAGEEAAARIRALRVEPRQGPALRCRELAIGYLVSRDAESAERSAAATKGTVPFCAASSDTADSAKGDSPRFVARGINVEIDHGARAAIVGDNGQGKTTFLRSVVDSLPPLAGEARWGYGCQIGIYAQHVYTSLPEEQTVLEYLERSAAPGTKDQEVLDLAGALLFRGEHVGKRISVLSGGERARLCLAGLLLGQFNVLVLDEPGNHLDVDTVEALAEALLAYRGTILFTSHDRHFLKHVATCIIEVRDGRVLNYSGGYEAYLYSVTREIDEGERQAARGLSKSPPPAAAASGLRRAQSNRAASARRAAPVTTAKSPRSQPRRNEREVRKDIAAVERTIARLEEQQRQLNEQFLSATDPAESLRLHDELAALAPQLAAAEDRWCRLNEELGNP